ncbi:hypothetical protein BCL76_105271 [Streptomyces sp. CG 926]|uniref:hypothetical protein n=1 Tax=Streptomyces sp. CG 926 TaxID=1882405 RepID=UPI000D6D9A6C|nr:hypothetical protein [Streptomyces sp. CG 926]PWK70318.1 hypothetical protein BCL76_105271 [Streptomyces sp. CG 926]
MQQKLLVVALIVMSGLLVAFVAGACLRAVGADWQAVLAGGGAAFVATVGVGFLIVNYVQAP